MNKFTDLSQAAIIILVIVIIIELWFFVDDTEERRAYENIDANKDGVISRAELKMYLDNITKIRESKKIRTKDIYKNFVSGALRGLVMGFLLSDWEGGVVLGLMMGLLNPVIMTAEKLM
jgi:F0F1-type ATP synthase assembly protein I